MVLVSFLIKKSIKYSFFICFCHFAMSKSAKTIKNNWLYWLFYQTWYQNHIKQLTLFTFIDFGTLRPNPRSELKSPKSSKSQQSQLFYMVSVSFSSKKSIKSNVLFGFGIMFDKKSIKSIVFNCFRCFWHCKMTKTNKNNLLYLLLY